jgi:2-polyprenyl-6-methoxyphenol hydroxylase-like FAD-dependent oxidoreductase
MSATAIPVLIAGGGPVGLALAIELGVAGSASSTARGA